MGKKRATLVLVVVLLILFFGWWGIEVLYPSNMSSAGAQPAFVDGRFPVVIHHARKSGKDMYWGSLELASGCGLLSSGIKAAGQAPAHVTLLLAGTKNTSSCSARAATSSDDFAVSFENPAAYTAVFDGVQFNGAATSYTIVEAK